MMKQTILGNTGIKVSRAGFGGLPMRPSQLALPVEEGAAVLRYALERGFNFVDTAQARPRAGEKTEAEVLL